MTSADHNTVQVNQIASDGTIGERKNYLCKYTLLDSISPAYN